jgi:hypothetical protein
VAGYVVGGFLEVVEQVGREFHGNLLETVDGFSFLVFNFSVFGGKTRCSGTV